MSLIETHTNVEHNAPNAPFINHHQNNNNHQKNHSPNKNIDAPNNAIHPILIDAIEKGEEVKEVKKEKNEAQIEGKKHHDDTALEEWQILKEMTIDGDKCKLVPYTADHVQQYNKWLNDPEIQQMTRTEPYSLEQEYEYQEEWKNEETKYIFIVLDKGLEDAMAGDINIFLMNDIAELNIMIAEEKSRRKGIATETLQLIIEFARKYLEIRAFIAKISADNESSIKLFKKMGFVQTEFVEAFKEYTFTLTFEEIDNKKLCNDKVKLGTVKYTD